MKRAFRIIVPLILALALIVGTAWYFLEYDQALTKELLLTLPLEAGHVYRLTEEDHIVTRDSRYRTNNVDSAYTVWGVYDFTGKVILPLGCTRAELKAAGY